MCVIIIKPANAAMPDRAELFDAFCCNPDGCGFISETRFYKGLSFESFMKELNKVPKGERCIIHFRLATHGTIKRSNCHPFIKGDIGFAHNGILSIRPAGDLTDSETAFRYILYPIASVYGIDSRELENAVNLIIGSSKFAFMQNGKIKTFGNFVKYKGRYYSNTRHLKNSYSFV